MVSIWVFVQVCDRIESKYTSRTCFFMNPSKRAAVASRRPLFFHVILFSRRVSQILSFPRPGSSGRVQEGRHFGSLSIPSTRTRFISPFLLNAGDPTRSPSPSSKAFAISTPKPGAPTRFLLFRERSWAVECLLTHRVANRHYLV